MEPAPKPVPPPGPAPWRLDPPPTPPAERDRGLPRRAFVTLLVLLAVAGAIAAALTWAGPRPAAALVPLWLAGPTAAPPQTDRDRVAILKSGLVVPPGLDPAPAATRSAVEARLQAVAALPGGQSAIVYVSGQAACDANGRVVLLPADAADRPQNGVLLRDILERLRDAGGRRKLLVLDLGWPAADPTAGLVPGRIPAELDAVPDPDRLVLCSCGPGQVPLAADELGRTAFGFYLEEGLRGWAAPAGASAVTAHDLARFVQARVRRWAEQTRGARQTPTLLGDGPDFPLVAVHGGRPADPLELPPLGDYPAWLREAWATRDRLRAAGANRADPRRFHRLEDVILAAESAWRGGAEAVAVRRQLQDDVTRLTAVLDGQAAPVAYAPGSPVPPTLAARAAAPEPALVEAVREYLRASATGKPEDAAKAAGDLSAKLRTKPAADAARVIFEAAANERAISADAVRRLDDLIRSLDPRPRAVETAFLSRLAETARAVGPAEWPAAAAARALAVARDGERAARPVAFPVAAPLLEAAMRDRYDGESLLLAAGFAPVAAADPPLARAADRYEQAARVQAACDAADAELTRAVAVLPGTLRFAAARPEFADRWHAAAAAARVVADARQAIGRGGSADDVLRAAGELEEAVRRFATRLAAVAEPFRPEKVNEAVSAARRPDPAPDSVRLLDALLASPLLTAEQRGPVWQAMRDAGRKLTEATRAADAADGQPAPTGDAVPLYRGEWGTDELAERDRRTRELAAAVALLRLAGRTVPPPLAPFEDRQAAADVGPDPAGRLALADDLRTAWAAAPPAGDPARLDRIAKFAPPDIAIPGLTDADEPPAARVRARDAAAFRDWLAGWYEHVAADPAADGLFAAAALDLRLADRSAPQPPPKPTGNPAGVELTPSSRAAVYPVRVELPSGVRPDLEVTAVAPGDEWIAVMADPPRTGDGPFADAAVRVALTPEAETAAVPPPRGFLVRVRSGGRSTYLRVPVGLTAIRDRLELFLSPNPKEPTGAAAGVAIRPGGGRQPAYLYLRNPGDRPRTLTVELGAGGKLLAAAVKVPPRETVPVRFPPAPVTPPVAPAGTPVANAPGSPGPPPLDELDGPLVLRVLDADRGGAVVLRREVRPEVQNPAGYVQLVAVRVHPPGPKTDGRNRVEVVLRATGKLAPAPKAELVIDAPTGTPPPPAGTLRGELPADADLRLFADGVATAPGGGVSFWVNIDGVERVYLFHAVVPSAGDPVVPPLATAADVIIVAPPAVPSSPRLPVRVAVDNPPPNATLDLALGRLTAGGMEPDILKVYPTARHTRIGWGQTSDGGLQFDGTVRDWTADLDAGQIRGRRVLRARLLDAAGGEVRTASATVLLDDQPAERVAFDGLPKQAKLGSKLTVKAIGHADVSGVKEVQFFLGKPADGKLPPNAATVPGRPTDPDRTVWTADLALPKDRPGPLDVGAKFVTNTGVTAFAAGTVELVEIDPDQAAPGKITGVLREGQVPQAGLEVVLKDDKGAEKGKTKTGPTGAFTFEAVPPGAYKVTARKPVSGSEKVASADVKLGPKEEKRVPLDLYLKGR